MSSPVWARCPKCGCRVSCEEQDHDMYVGDCQSCDEYIEVDGEGMPT